MLLVFMLLYVFVYATRFNGCCSIVGMDLVGSMYGLNELGGEMEEAAFN